MSSVPEWTGLKQITSTAVERYLAGTHHGNGMVFDAKIRLDRKLDQAALKEAWTETVQLNPQLFGVWCGKGQKAHWQLQPFDPHKFNITVATDLDRRKHIGTLNPSNGVSAKLVVSEVEAYHDFFLWFFFHHVGCDGVGAIRIISRTLQNYTRAASRSADGASTPETASSTARTASGAETDSEQGPHSIPDPRNVWSTIRGSNLRIDSSHVGAPRPRGPTPVTAANQDQASLESFPSHERFSCSPEPSHQLRSWLRDHQVALNDFSVAVAFHALSETHRKNPKKFVCIMNPVQTRTWAHRRATRNHIGFAFIRRRVGELSDFASTLESVQTELIHIRSESISQELASGLEVFEKIPGVLKLIERTGWFCPTASVTCLASLKLGRRHGMSGNTKIRSRSTRYQTKESRQTLKSSFIGDARVKDIEIVGPLQSRGQLAITIWEGPRGISATFRHADATVQVACREIAQHFCKIFSTRIET